MVALLQRLSSTKLFPIVWTLVTITLLCLPGKAIPGLGIFGIKHIDKLGHFVLFGGFVFFWGLYIWQQKKPKADWFFAMAGLTLLSILIGIVMEYVQVHFIPNRSFDVLDIWADVIGSVVVMFILIRFGKRLGFTL